MDGSKRKFALWAYPETLDRVKALYRENNCKSQSEFIEKAIAFYAGYLVAGSDREYLPAVFLSGMQGMVKETENRIARLLFKLAVEMDMTMNILAAMRDVDDGTLARLRERCMAEVRKTNGSIRLEDAVRYQSE